ncbi:MAG: LPS export ABC transporter periplasmic protein LptC [Deltaproteobacteria bacterium]|nr:LPS export ABC transporter periplasmic protein LptC [Deltaproteobacteria bacterium]
MKNFASNNRRGWRRFLGWRWLAGLAVLLVVGVWGLSALNRPAPPPPKPPPPETAGRMETLSLTEIVEGDKRWVLEAKHADFDKDQLQVKISGVKVDFFGPGEHVSVKADEGLFNTKTRVLTLKGDVEMARGGMLIKTSLAIYEPGSRVLSAPEDVLLTEPTLRVQGKGLRVDLAKKQLVLAQHRLTEVKVQEGMLKH